MSPADLKLVPPAPPVDRERTGICAVCAHRHKLTRAKKMVDHGYRISDGFGHYFGHRSGKCYGVGFGPRELSNEGNIRFRRYLWMRLRRNRVLLVRLRAGAVDELTQREWEQRGGDTTQRLKIYRPEDARFDTLLGQRIYEMEREQQAIERQIERQTLLIASWVRAPLYGECKR